MDWSITNHNVWRKQGGDKKRFPTRRGEYLQAGSRKRTRAGAADESRGLHRDQGEKLALCFVASLGT